MLRALRTRQAVVLCGLYVLTSAAGAALFTRGLLAMENAAAEALGVPATVKPGAMLNVLREKDYLRDMLQGMLDSSELVDLALTLPVLTVFHFWLGLGLVSFLGAGAGADVLSEDLQNRSIRFEGLRTGRLELVCGRFLGRSALVAVATLLAVSGTLVVGQTLMVQVDPVAQLWSLLLYSPRLFFFTLPFLGLGVACSQLTAAPNVARILAGGATTATWVLAGWLESLDPSELSWWTDALRQLLPQFYMTDLWRPGLGWLPAAGLCLVLGFAATMLGFPFFSRRNL